MDVGPAGALHNACVLTNYRQIPDQPSKFSYFAAEIDWDGHYRGFKLFRITKFDGSNWINLFSIAVPELEIDRDYEITLTVYPHPQAEDAWLVARLRTVTDNSIDITLGPLAVDNYVPATGPCGFGSNRSMTYFTNFTVERITQS